MDSENKIHDLRKAGKHVIVKKLKSNYVLVSAHSSKEEALSVWSSFSLAKKSRHKLLSPLVKISLKGFSHDPRISYPGAFAESRSYL
jgi:hypothetical protein